MNEVKTVNQHPASPTGGAEAHEHPVDFNSYLRRCALVFVTAVGMISLMVAASFAPIGGWPVKVAVILAVAGCNAFVVAGFLMHLLSEKKMIYTVLAFTVFFAAAMMWLTVYAMQDFPTGTVTH
jgi:caa(3)-type oxidase subunit IV